MVRRTGGIGKRSRITTASPHIQRTIEELGESFLSRSGDFIERLLVSVDEYAVNVVAVGVFEGLKANCDNDKVRALLGPACAKEFEAITY